MNTNRIIFVLSQEPSRHTALHTVLERDGWTCKTATTVTSFLHLASSYRNATCAFVDAVGIDRRGLQRAMTQSDLHIPLVFISTQPSNPLATNAIRQGAVAALCEPLTVDDIESAIVSAFGSRRLFDLKERVREQFHRLNALSERQRKILQLASEGVPNKRIASQLELSVKTVERDRRKAYSSIGVKSTAEMTRAIVIGGLHDLVETTIGAS